MSLIFMGLAIPFRVFAQTFRKCSPVDVCYVPASFTIFTDHRGKYPIRIIFYRLAYSTPIFGIYIIRYIPIEYSLC